MYSTSFEQYLNDLASSLPTPGGGSASALVASVGCACLSMSINFTLGKEKYKPVEKEMKAFLEITEDCRKKLMELIDEDVSAYTKIGDVWKTPKGNPNRDKKIQNALKSAVAVPLEICKTCLRVIKICKELAQKCNKNLITDVGVGVLLLESAHKSAVLNVRINLVSIKDKTFIEYAQKEIDFIAKEMENISKETMGIVENIVGGR